MNAPHYRSYLHPWFFALLVACAPVSPVCPTAVSAPGDSLNSLSEWLRHAAVDMERLDRSICWEMAFLQARRRKTAVALQAPGLSLRAGYDLLLEKHRLDDSLQTLEAALEMKRLRLRYRKSIELLKLLYEKILGMDHHFSSLKAQQKALQAGNPHEYPAFREARGLLEQRMKRRYGLVWPALLESNPYLTAIFSVMGVMLSGESKENQARLDQITCILDFTVRMHQELNLIYYEMEYLREANLGLKRDCENLFADCTRPIGYAGTLESCRESDDWERLGALLDAYAMDTPQAADPDVRYRQQVNLRFAIDRVVHFIEKYTLIVAQGNDYYKKFARIVDGYQNERSCAPNLPTPFEQLKVDIRITLDKFNHAYALPEIQGSRLKELLYGLPEK